MAVNVGNRAPVVMLRIKQVTVRVGLSKSTIYNKLDKSSRYFDPDFPKPVPLGRSVVAWVEHEINDWLWKRINKRE